MFFFSFYVFLYKRKDLVFMNYWQCFRTSLLNFALFFLLKVLNVLDMLPIIYIHCKVTYSLYELFKKTWTLLLSVFMTCIRLLFFSYCKEVIFIYDVSLFFQIFFFFLRVHSTTYFIVICIQQRRSLYFQNELKLRNTSLPSVSSINSYDIHAITLSLASRNEPR